MSSKPIKKTVLLIKKIAEFESNWYNMKKLLMCNKNLICLLESQIYPEFWHNNYAANAHSRLIPCIF